MVFEDGSCWDPKSEQDLTLGNLNYIEYKPSDSRFTILSPTTELRSVKNDLAKACGCDPDKIAMGLSEIHEETAYIHLLSNQDTLLLLKHTPDPEIQRVFFIYYLDKIAEDKPFFTKVLVAVSTNPNLDPTVENLIIKYIEESYNSSQSDVDRKVITDQIQKIIDNSKSQISLILKLVSNFYFQNDIFKNGDNLENISSRPELTQEILTAEYNKIDLTNETGKYRVGTIMLLAFSKKTPTEILNHIFDIAIRNPGRLARQFTGFETIRLLDYICSNPNLDPKRLDKLPEGYKYYRFKSPNYPTESIHEFISDLFNNEKSISYKTYQDLAFNPNTSTEDFKKIVNILISLRKENKNKENFRRILNILSQAKNASCDIDKVEFIIETLQGEGNYNQYDLINDIVSENPNLCISVTWQRTSKIDLILTYSNKNKEFKYVIGSVPREQTMDIALKTAKHPLQTAKKLLYLLERFPNNPTNEGELFFQELFPLIIANPNINDDVIQKILNRVIIGKEVYFLENTSYNQKISEIITEFWNREIDTNHPSILMVDDNSDISEKTKHPTKNFQHSQHPVR